METHTKKKSTSQQGIWRQRPNMKVVLWLNRGRHSAWRAVKFVFARQWISRPTIACLFVYLFVSLYTWIIFNGRSTESKYRGEQRTDNTVLFPNITLKIFKTIPSIHPSIPYDPRLPLEAGRTQGHLATREWTRSRPYSAVDDNFRIFHRVKSILFGGGGWSGLCDVNWRYSNLR